MSNHGIKSIAKVFSLIQQERQRLIQQAKYGTPSGNEDIRLAQLLDKAKEAIKDDFRRITSENIKRPN